MEGDRSQVAAQNLPLSTAEAEKLISAVHKRKPLWDPTAKGYHDRKMKKKLWDDISDELNTSQDYLRTKWRNIRDTFRKELSKTMKESPNASGESVFKSKWRHFESLLFLTNITSAAIAKRKTKVEEVEFGEAEEEVDFEVAEEVDYREENDENDDGDDDDDDKSKIPLIFDKQDNNADDTEPLAKKLKHTNDTEKITILDTDDIDAECHFLLSLIPELKKVPAHRKLQTQIRIQQVILEEQYQT